MFLFFHEFPLESLVKTIKLAFSANFDTDSEHQLAVLTIEPARQLFHDLVLCLRTLVKNETILLCYLRSGGYQLTLLSCHCQIFALALKGPVKSVMFLSSQVVGLHQDPLRHTLTCQVDKNGVHASSCHKQPGEYVSEKM